MIKFAGNVLFIFQLILLLLLFACRFIPVVNPQEYGVYGILGLFVIPIGFLNFLLLIVWVIRRSYYKIGMNLIGTFLAWNVLQVCFAFRFIQKNNAPGETSFSIMSYNVRLLDLYDWTGDRNTRKNLLKFIKEKSPDVLCLQEFYSKDNSGLDNIKAIKQAGNYPYEAEGYIRQSGNRHWGSIIFSKFPIVQNEKVKINESNANVLQQCVLRIHNKLVSVYNLHLHSNKLGSEERVILEGKDLSGKAQEIVQHSKSIFHKLLQAYGHRGGEANLSAYVIEEDVENPVIVCGDLNDLPSSYTYFSIRGKLKDAFLEKGRFFGPTYNAPNSFLRIDYMFYRDDLNLLKFEKFRVPYSDHFPIIATYSL